MEIIISFLLGVLCCGLFAVYYIKMLKKNGYLETKLTSKFQKEFMKTQLHEGEQKANEKVSNTPRPPHVYQNHKN